MAEAADKLDDDVADKDEGFEEDEVAEVLDALCLSRS